MASNLRFICNNLGEMERENKSQKSKMLGGTNQSVSNVDKTSQNTQKTSDSQKKSLIRNKQTESKNIDKTLLENINEE